MSEPETMIYDAAVDRVDDEATTDETSQVTPHTTALATVTTSAQSATLVGVQHTREEIDALKNMLKAANREMTDAQFVVFMAAANHLGLDPLARQVVPIFQGGRMTVQTTIDGFRLIAERTRKYRGQIGPFWCGKDGVWQDVWLADDAPVAAKVGVKRSDFDEPMWGVARTKSYSKGTSSTWRDLPDVMIAKVAESLALRKAFPAELSGAYTAEELIVVDADPMPATPATPASSATSTVSKARSAAASSAAHEHAPIPASIPVSAQTVDADEEPPTWPELGQAAKDLGLSKGEWVQTVKAITGHEKLTDDDRRVMADWLKQRRAQFAAADSRTPPLETLSYARA